MVGNNLGNTRHKHEFNQVHVTAYISTKPIKNKLHQKRKIWDVQKLEEQLHLHQILYAT